MTKFEVLTLLIALLAVVPAALALIRQSAQRKRMDQLEDAQLRQNRATAALHEKQLELLLSSNAGRASAHVKLDLYLDNKTYRFRVTNVGSAQARNVQVKIIAAKEEHDPIAGTDYDSKFPAPVLEPGSSISFYAAIYLDSPLAYNALVTWEDLDGMKAENTTYVAA
ncbi:hypothetical protein [Xanthomonas euvesicatoria]|uniref:hypothetical protein n=1 Tax=Xanthomonas euvesicatoria TaxID=456327 RepID=UPI00059CA9C9|nr:hypothetical protein [Xanthomonas euvesicatoria]PPU86498.1 hypothetical protein XaclCFBP3371_21235 [Xanthomonas euvesicatoria pv. citrumelonis]TKA17525.1 hypothetical protein TN51_09700 [Xanthomonas euvesicatoria pv. citrumelonis]